MRKKYWIVGIVLSVLIILGSAFGSILYITGYKTERVDVQQSPDYVYEVELQSVGEPDWPFGSAHGRLLLSENGTLISKRNIKIANDGSSFSKNAWNVTWQSDYVEIVLFGEEQYDELVRLYFNGQVESTRLETHYGRQVERRSKSNTTDSTTIEDDLEKELFPGQWQIEDGYLATYDFVSDSGSPSNDFEIYYGASETSSRCVVSETENTIQYLVYDRNSLNNECGLYVYYQCERAADGIWDYDNGRIIDIYAYVYESGAVVSSGKTQWTDTGSASYQEATGEN